VKIALVTTPLSARSGIADYTRHLLPHLRAAGAEVQLFVEVGREREESAGETLRSVADLRPREHDRILYQLGNEVQHAFMAPLVRALGGTVMLHDWVLFDLASAAYPELARGGWRGLRRAWSEGGLEQARTWLRHRRGRAPVSGWFPPEQGGRWSAAIASLDCGEASRLALDLHVPDGRRWSLLQGARALARGDSAGDHALEVELGSGALELRVRGARATDTDHRPLGVFLREVRVERGAGWEPLDLAGLPQAGELGPSAARFELPLNRSIVRHADAFLVHSDWVGEQVLASRNAPTPIHRVHHGVQPRWSGAPREELRARLDLPAGWQGSFLLGCFGAVQRHKRPEVVLEALGRAVHAGLDARLLWIGEERPAEYDLLGQARARGLEARVRITGWLEEEEAWSALEALDLGIQLRGPSTGGTSGGVAQLHSVGRPVVTTRCPEFAHFPAGLWCPPGPDEVRNLAQVVLTLAEDRPALEESADLVRKAVEEELHWSHAARRYLEVLEVHPHARSARRSIAARLLQARATRERA
jgi:glycosyltransferase involved in cell wall biosynthesis